MALRKDEKPVRIVTSSFKTSLTPGSSDSIALHRAFHDSDSNNIFSSSSVRNLIEYKWNKVWWVGLIWTILYVIYLISLMYMPGYKWILFCLIVQALIEFMQGVLAFGCDFKGYCINIFTFHGIARIARLALMSVYISTYLL